MSSTHEGGWYEARERTLEEKIREAEQEIANNFQGGIENDWHRRDLLREERRRRDEQRALEEERNRAMRDVWGRWHVNEAPIEGAPDEEDEDEEITGHVESFIEAYDVPKRDIPKLTRILDKPHSDRSDADKKLLKKIIRKSKKLKKPKIKLTRQ